MKDRIHTVEQFIIDFQLQHQLVKPEKFAQWLTTNLILGARSKS
jgi:hypothetical protein